MIRILKRPNIQSLFIRMYSNATQSNEVLCKKVNHVGCITLNRPKQLNALNLTMVKEMQKNLEDFESDDNIKAIIIKGAGETAFCAGGDIKTIRQNCLDGKKAEAMSFFKEEYKLNYKINNLSKPYIALLNGVTMGGGVGVSVHGKYRVATEKTLFAMPETAIGFFGDVGGSYFLSRIRDHVGLYLVLTGNRLKGKDVTRVGIATHYTSLAKLPELEQSLYNENDLTPQKVYAILNKYNEEIPDSFDTSKISKIFSSDSIEQIIENLEKDNSDWSKQQLSLLSKMSPSSLKVSVRQLQLGHEKDLKDCLKMEYNLCSKFITKNDFSEGVRAVLIDKGSKPKWDPATVRDIDEKLLNWYFEPAADDELDI